MHRASLFTRSIIASVACLALFGMGAVASSKETVNIESNKSVVNADAIVANGQADCVYLDDSTVLSVAAERPKLKGYDMAAANDNYEHRFNQQNGSEHPVEINQVSEQFER